MPKIRVKYERGVLVPLEKLDLSEGEVVEVELREPLSKNYPNTWDLSKRRALISKKLIGSMSTTERVFVDSGVIIGFFAGDRTSIELIDKLGDFDLYINDTVFSEVTYKLMVLKYLEEADRFRFHEFKRHFSDLEIYVTIFEFIKDAEMKILAVTEDVVSEAVEIGRLYRPSTQRRLNSCDMQAL